MQNETRCSMSREYQFHFRSETRLFADHDSQDSLCVLVDSVNNGAWLHHTKANECKLCDPAVVTMMREGGRAVLAYLDFHSNAS